MLKRLFLATFSLPGAELETIKALFNEKEKELSVAVAKVDELSKQLDQLRNGRLNGSNTENKMTTPAMLELDKLRRELMVNNAFLK